MNYKITSFFLLITPLIFASSIIAQEDFDEAYLNSLPDEIKEDVMKEIKSSQDEKTNKFPNKPSSQISNIEIIKDWERFKKSKEMSERYGMRLFRSMQTSFMPVNEPNFDNSYVLNVGDIIEVQIVSQKTSIEDLELNSYKRKREQIHEHKSSQDGNTNIEKILFFRNDEQISGHTVIISRKDRLKIKTWFRSKDVKPSLAITIRKKSGEIVGSAGSHNDKKEFLEINDEKFFEVDFPQIPLLKGNYYVDISLFCEHGVNTLDFAKKILTLKVIQEDLEQGIVHLNHKWRTKP